MNIWYVEVVLEFYLFNMKCFMRVVLVAMYAVFISLVGRFQKIVENSLGYCLHIIESFLPRIFTVHFMCFLSGNNYLHIMKLTLFLVYSAVVSHTLVDCPVVIPKRVLSSLAVILCASPYTFPFIGNHQSSLYLVSMYSLLGSYIYFCLIIAFMRMNSNMLC